MVANRFSRALIPIALLIFGTPFIALMFYASPHEDDFARATASFDDPLRYYCAWRPHPHTMAAMVWNEYTKGSARWVTSLLDNLALNKLNLVSSYSWLLLLVMSTNIAALSYFFAALLRVPRARAVLAACIFYAAWLASVVRPGENIFWLTGAIEYQLTLSAMLVLAALLSKTKQTAWGYVALVILTIAIPGEHEIAGAFLLPCLIAGALIARALELQTRQWYLCVGLAAFSFAVVMLSPGNFLKLSLGHPMEGYVAHVFSYSKQAINHGFDWALSPAVLLSAFSIPLLLWPGKDSPPAGSEHLPPRWLARAALGAMGVLLGEFAIAEMSSGYGELPPRTVIWFQFIFSLLLVCAFLIGVPEISQIRFSPSARIGILTLLVVSLLGSANFRAAEKDLRGPARAWGRASFARLTQRGGSLLFAPLPPTPRLFDETALSTDSGCWVNECMALYLGASTVGLKGPSENHWLAWAVAQGQDAIALQRGLNDNPCK